MLSKETEKLVLDMQKNEITEYHIYKNLSLSVKAARNRSILEKIADEELKHYELWKKITGVALKADKLKIWKYSVISKIFGITFTSKLMEQGEKRAQVLYGRISEFVPESKSIIEDEDRHEHQLIDLIEEDRLRYISSMILGLNDALVELTGTLAGLSLVFRKTKLIAVAGLVTGIAAAFSMAGSEYLSQKSEDDKSKNPLRASIYTGIVYSITVCVLILPYLIFQNPFLCIAVVISSAVLIIWIFTFYVAVATDKPFKERFTEMVLISLGVAALSFAVGYVVRILFNIEI